MACTNSISKEIHLVTGEGGYAGYHLGIELSKKKNVEIILLDVIHPKGEIPENVQFKKIDIRNYEEVKEALAYVSCVYHLASYGMSGREQLKKNLIQEVNLQGTENIINACKEQNVCRIVYTSTYNVVFGGQVIENGNESLPYFPYDKQPDYYSSTKTMAEKKVMSANGTKMKNGNTLKTCALRLAGVYGPGEQRHLPRIVKIMENGLFQFVYGDPDSKVEFLHKDNLVQAHVLAGEALGETRKHIAAGQCYFVSDGKPINNFEFFRPLVEGLGYRYPSIRLPISLIYFIAFIIEWIHFVVGRVYNFQPFLTRTEVYKTGVTHWFCLDKARTELGYIPTIQNDLDACVEWFKSRGHGKLKLPRSGYTLVQFIKDLILVIIFVCFTMSLLPMTS